VNANAELKLRKITVDFFLGKVYRRVLGPVYDNEKENWRILTNKVQKM
jgi:hypothetical protein